MTSLAPTPIWTPPSELVERAALSGALRQLGLDDYQQLWRWSVDDVGRFWRWAWERFDVQADGSPALALADASMPGARWFPDVALSFPEHLLRDRDPAAAAVWHASELRELDVWTWADLTRAASGVRAGLRAMGVARGDRVVGCLPNVPETLAAFLAVASLGATWSCCSPDFGTRSMVDRFAQIEPKVLLAVDGYRYGGKDFDRRDAMRELEAALPTLERTVRLPYLFEEGDWPEAFAPSDEPLAFERVPFDHPLWILYSSGTTGVPKAIVHGHGGILLELLKAWGLQHDVGPGERVQWFTTTGWMMWNYLVSALLTGAEVVLWDGHPTGADGGVLWDLAERSGATFFGGGASFLHGCMKAGMDPAAGRDLSRVNKVGSTGSPLAPAAYDWVRDTLGADVWLASVSGGTDVCTALLGASPLVPVYAGELQARCLGVSVEAWDAEGRPVVDEVGELVVTQPMPSMPVRLWNDPGDERYRASYFSTYPGVWRQGDWVELTARGSAIVHGRSDATINRGGVRVGTAEVYGAVLALEEIEDALVVDVPSGDETELSWMPLFVVLAEGAELDDALRARVRARVREDCSPRHVPDDVIAVPAVPRTLTGKVLEVPVKRLLAGAEVGAVASRDALADPDALEWFADYARARRA